MNTETPGRPRTAGGAVLSRIVALLATAWIVGGPPVPPASAQVRTTPHTEVRSIRFEGARSVSEHALRKVLRTQSRGRLHGLRRALGALPLIAAPAPHPFRPRVLQEDVVRLRTRYAAAGFEGSRVSYRVAYDESKDLLDVVFVVEEGVPLQVVEATVVPADAQAALPVPEDRRESWERVTREVRALAGRRLDAAELEGERNRIQAWWRNRGFPAAVVNGTVDRDTLAGRARVRYAVDAGARRRIGRVTVEGNRTLSDRTVLGHLPFTPGDYYSERALDRGQRDLRRLPIVRNARVDVAGGTSAVAAAADTPLDVAVTVAEAKPRVISGVLGYGFDTGWSVGSTWSHRNFTGGARVLTVSGLAQTGRLAISGNPDTRYRGSVSLQQPNFLRSGLSAVVSPFVEYREDTQDRSLQIGSNFTLVYELNRRTSVSLDYQIANRRIYEYRFDELFSGNVDLLTFLSQIAQGRTDSLGTHAGTSLITLSGLAGNVDDLANPGRGVLVRPSLQVTAPTGWSRTSYWKADASGYAFAPISRRSTLTARVTAGRLFPFGKSLPAEGEDPLITWLQLRDAALTAGGSSDVRGWSERNLGPKFPDVRFRASGDTLEATSDGYVPEGGFSRLSFSLELRLPMPGFGPRLGSHLFLDGGRVWTDDRRFDTGPDILDQERFFYACGAGMEVFTPVGAMKLSLGYKLNPSVTDLVNSRDVLRALLDDSPLDDLPRHQWRRLQVNLTFGTSY